MSEKDTKPPLISILMRTHARRLLRCAGDRAGADGEKRGYEVVVVGGWRAHRAGGYAGVCAIFPCAL